MQETYVAIGSRVSEFNALFGIGLGALLLLLSPWVERKRKKSMLWTSIGFLAWHLLCLFVRIPDPFYATGMILAMGAGAYADGRRMKTLRKVDAWAIPIFFPALAIFSAVMMLRIGREDVIITDDAVTQTDTFRGDISVPRNKMEIDAADFTTDGVREDPDDWMWTLYANDEPGPTIFADHLYWHNNRIVNGNDLGHRISRWANVEPEYRVYKRTP